MKFLDWLKRTVPVIFWAVTNPRYVINTIWIGYAVDKAERIYVYRDRAQSIDDINAKGGEGLK